MGRLCKITSYTYSAQLSTLSLNKKYIVPHMILAVFIIKYLLLIYTGELIADNAYRKECNLQLAVILMFFPIKKITSNHICISR